MTEKTKYITTGLIIGVILAVSLGVSVFNTLKGTPAKVNNFAQWFDQTYGH
ncbi:hypothetical protein [Paenibacillus polymyxa]|uniref:hypothetical protein n=1 Tax=Paenibacillus polymyxa TaxID=1406 RepID=UPI003217BF28